MKPTYQQLEEEVTKLREQLANKPSSALQESEEKFRDAFKSSVDSMTIATVKDGLYVEVNDAFTEITGYSWDDVKGKTIGDIRIWENETDRQRLIKTLKNEGVIRNMEARFRKKNGQIVQGLISGSFIKIHGENHLLLIVRHIDDLKKAENSLNEAQKLGKIGSWDMDWITRELLWSDQLFRFFELDKNKIGPDFELFKAFIHPQDRIEAVTELRSSIRNKTKYQHQHRVLLKNGQIKWVVEKGRTFYDVNGLPLRSVGTVQDITEQKLAEDALRKSEGLFQSLATISPVGIFRTDMEGETTYVNPKWCKLSGMARTAAMGNGWLRAVHPDDRKKMTVLWDETVNQSGSSVSDYRFLHADGSVVYVRGYSVPEFDSANQIVGYVGTITDITEQVQATETLKEQGELLTLITRNYPHSIVSVLNEELRIELLSGSFLRDLNYDFNSIQGRLVEDILSEHSLNDVEGLMKVYAQAFEGKKVTQELSIEAYDFIFYVTPLYSQDEKVTKILSIAEDVTQIKKAEYVLKNLNETLEQKVAERTDKLEKAQQAMTYLLEDMQDAQNQLTASNEQLKQLNHELEAFSYSVSHDLKAPLRAINGFSGFLKEDYYQVLGEDGRRLLDDIIKNTGDMGHLIDGLLSLSRTGRKTLQKVVFDLKPLAQSVFSEQIKYYNLPHAKLEVADYMLPLFADYTLFKQLITNLISNALKYSSKESNPLVRIGCKKDHEQKIYFVQDNGVGFDMHYAGKMFDTFQRLHSKEEYEGTGIGLSIVQRIIIKHGGKIWAEGEVNKGATLFFTLPEKK